MNHDKMIEVLMNVEIDSRDILITANLHWKQTARVRSIVLCDETIFMHKLHILTTYIKLVLALPKFKWKETIFTCEVIYVNTNKESLK